MQAVKRLNDRQRHHRLMWMSFDTVQHTVGFQFSARTGQFNNIRITTLSTILSSDLISVKMQTLVNPIALNMQFIFTALHALHATESSHEKAVCPSVCLSDKRVICNKTKESCTHILYHMKVLV